MLSFAFLDWNILATFSGAVGLTVIIVQMLKLPLDKVWKIPTRYVVYTICFLTMLGAQYFLKQTLSLELLAMTAINAFVGTLTAMSLYDRVIEMPEWEKLSAAYDYMITGQLPGENDGDETQEAEGVEDADGKVFDMEITNWDEALLRSFCEHNGIDIAGCTTREEIINRIELAAEAPAAPATPATPNT